MFRCRRSCWLPGCGPLPRPRHGDLLRTRYYLLRRTVDWRCLLGTKMLLPAVSAGEMEKRVNFYAVCTWLLAQLSLRWSANTPPYTPAQSACGGHIDEQDVRRPPQSPVRHGLPARARPAYVG